LERLRHGWSLWRRWCKPYRSSSSRTLCCARAGGSWAALPDAESP